MTATRTSSNRVLDALRSTLSKMIWQTAGQFFMGVEPVPASRPRVSKWGTYYAATYKNWLKAAGLAIAKWNPGRVATGPLVLVMEVICTKARTSKLTFPRGDIDNFAKGPLDVITKSEKVWSDDNQVVGLIAFKRFAEPGEEPGTRIEILELEPA